jgi:iron complex outermembrane receptor protein
MVAAVSSAIGASPASAQTPQNSQLPVLKQLSIEELLQLDVTLPLRREERLMDAPAAVTLLTSEDLRRQGAVSLPEALRHVSGLFVARFSNSSWIVASRGFASTSANKMLVMIDGRSVYSPLFSGVFWDQQDASLFDLERVEIIRGPGASLWGSNAVNGVINVVSKRAADTQGVMVTVGGGAEEQLFTTARYGGRVGAGHYRVYGKAFRRDGANFANDADAMDDQALGQGGFRIDVGPSANAVTLQGDVYRTGSEAGAAQNIRADGVNMLARWTRRSSSRGELQLQTYFDRTHRRVPNQIEEDRNTWDLDVQHRYNIDARHTLNSGASYRLSADDTAPSALLRFEPAERTTHLLTAFAQDEFALTPAVTLVGGMKVEHNHYTGIEWQPSVRARWMPTRAHTWWAAVSRAVRMPTRFDTDVRVYQGDRLVATGSDDFKSETVVAYEGGYRTSPSPKFAVDITAYHNRYNDLRSQEFRSGRVVVENQLNDNTTGANITASVQPWPWIRLTGSYTRQTHDLSLDRGSTDVYRGQFETIDPDYMARFMARFDFPRGVELDLMSMFVGALPQIVPQIPGTPAYNEASVRVGWRVTSRLDLSLIGRDLLHDDHIEFISPTSSRVTRLERALFTRLTLAF